MPSTSAPSLKTSRLTWRMRLVRFLGMALIGYIGVILLLLFFETKLIFLPTCASEEWFEPLNQRVQDVELLSSDGSMIHAWWCPIQNWQPSDGAVLFCHGNGGNLSLYLSHLTRLHEQLGQAVLIFDYPGYGRSTGQPSEPGCYAAADAAYNWLTQTQEIPPKRVLLYGLSLGGGVAVDLASRRPNRALILVSTFTSIPDMAQREYPWLPARLLVRNRFESLAKIASCHLPILIAHGTADELIPFTQAERLFDATPQPKQFFPMDGHDHNGLPSPDFYAAIRKFLAKVEEKEESTTK